MNAFMLVKLKLKEAILCNTIKFNYIRTKSIMFQALQHGVIGIKFELTFIV